MKDEQSKEIGKWKTLKSQSIFDTDYLNVTEDLIRTPKGREINYAYYGKGVKSILVISVLKNKKIPLVYQFRYPHKKYFWELAAGKIDHNETPEEAAKRELEEEMNVETDKIVKLGKFVYSPGSTGAISYIFLAQNSKFSNTKNRDDHDDSEFIQKVETFTLEEIVKMIERGEIYHAPTVLAIYLYQDYLNRK